MIKMTLEEKQDPNESCVLGQLPAITSIKFEPVGRWYLNYCQRRFHKHSYHSYNSTSSEDSENEVDIEDDKDEEFLRTLDPADWKNQDHYAVLGLAKQRFEATDDHIKKAYKQKVLKHHPDKRKARGLSVKDGDDDYFTCITKAYEVLGIPTKRRSFDSVDPEFDDYVPSSNNVTPTNFYDTFKPIFERNSRWAKVGKNRKVPLLGDDSSTYDEVNSFYSFWYNLDSWREFSYLDEDDKEKGENRDERRWIEKQNKAARLQRKKDEMARIRKLIDNAYGTDPRIAKFKEEEKSKKIAQKNAKKEAAKLKAQQELEMEQEEKLKQQKIEEEKEEEAKAQAAALKKEREAMKYALKKERKFMRAKLKDCDYFATDETEKIQNIQDVDRLAELLSLTSLQELNEELNSEDETKSKEAFLLKVKEINEELEKEKQKQLESMKKPNISNGISSPKQIPWNEDETQALIKGVNLFPAGTVQRWETIAAFITQHVSTSARSPKEVLSKAKDLQKSDTIMKEAANKGAFEKFMSANKSNDAVENVVVSKRYDSVAEQQIGETGGNPAPWSADEQKMLEQAIKTYPASEGERWEKIAAVIKTRSKKDCMKRYKELVDMVKAKKAAASAVKKK